MNPFQQLQDLLLEVFAATVQNEKEVTQSYATVAVACLLQAFTSAPRVAGMQQRKASFSGGGGGGGAVPSPEELASAGFHGTGRGDEAICACCGLGLRDWSPSDLPAEVCHARFAAAASQATASDDEVSSPRQLPCLYLAVHRWLTSDLPLARKHLTTRGGRPAVPDAGAVAALSDRLQAIADTLADADRPDAAGDACWAVQNARGLGYNDHLIVAALWRLQTARPNRALDTTSLLRSILRVQEGGWESDCDELPERSPDHSPASEHEAELTSALQGPAGVSAPLADVLNWWVGQYSPSSTLKLKGSNASPRRKSHSVSS